MHRVRWGAVVLLGAAAVLVAPAVASTRLNPGRIGLAVAAWALLSLSAGLFLLPLLRRGKRTGVQPFDQAPPASIRPSLLGAPRRPYEGVPVAGYGHND